MIAHLLEPMVILRRYLLFFNLNLHHAVHSSLIIAVITSFLPCEVCIKVSNRGHNENITHVLICEREGYGRRFTYHYRGINIIKWYWHELKHMYYMAIKMSKTNSSWFILHRELGIVRPLTHVQALSYHWKYSRNYVLLL